jgi:hypothetical protein
MASDLRSKLEQVLLERERRTVVCHTAYGMALMHGAQLALEAVGCVYAAAGTTCISEETPPVRWCRVCVVAASLASEGKSG